MTDYGASTYGDRIAEVYDEMAAHARPEPVEPIVDVLADLAGGGRALELGIGTGRVALPLAARGVQVHGIDASQAMVDKLRAKEGGRSIPVAIGDFADVNVDGKFSLIFVVFNTFFGLLSQEDQVRCFGNVSDRLTESGVFLVEAFMPDLSRFVRGQNTSTVRVDTDRVMLDASRHDPVRQHVTIQHVVITD